MNGWAGHLMAKGELVKANPKRSRVKLLEDLYLRKAGSVLLVPNGAISQRREPAL
jgi:hypothetical protein